MTDTANKRASVINISLPWRGLLPIPDGTVSGGDFAQVAFMYRGIIDGSTPSPANDSEWLIRARRRGRR